LPLRVDSCGTWPTAVIEAVPGVPAPTVTAHLDQPRPNLTRRRVDGNGHRRRPLTVRDQLGTRIRPGDLLIGCAPAPERRTHPRCVNNLGCCHSGRDHNRGPASNRHTTPVGGCRHSDDRRPRQTDPVAVCDSVALICLFSELRDVSAGHRPGRRRPPGPMPRRKCPAQRLVPAMTCGTGTAESGHTAVHNAHRFPPLLLVYINPDSPCAFAHLL
jgi:hypothetical protein